MESIAEGLECNSIWEPFEKDSSCTDARRTLELTHISCFAAANFCLLKIISSTKTFIPIYC